MSRPVVGFLALQALLLAGWALWTGLRRRRADSSLVVSLVILQIGLLLQAAVAVVAVAAGRGPQNGGTFLAYLLASVGVLPFGLGRPGLGTSTTPGPGRSALLGVLCLGLSVVLVRMWTVFAEP